MSWEPGCPSSAFQIVHKLHKVQKGVGESGQSLAVLCGTRHCGQQPTDFSAGCPEETKAVSGTRTPPPPTTTSSPSPNFSAFGSRGRDGRKFLLLPLARQ